jgi:hypothetical protein
MTITTASKADRMNNFPYFDISNFAILTPTYMAPLKITPRLNPFFFSCFKSFSWILSRTVKSVSCMEDLSFHRSRDVSTSFRRAVCEALVSVESSRAFTVATRTLSHCRPNTVASIKRLNCQALTGTRRLLSACEKAIDEMCIRTISQNRRFPVLPFMEVKFKVLFTYECG